MKPSTQYFYKYFSDWIEIYKQGAVRPVTYQKYMMTLQRLTEIAPKLRICDLNRRTYQALINDYAKTHERQTTSDFHRHLRSSILDAVDEGLITADPTRKAVIKGKAAPDKKSKFLNQYEIEKLFQALDLDAGLNWDWFILLVAKTGLRFAEALGLTPSDFDFDSQKIKVTKTWIYKADKGQFGETKNHSSKRTIPIDPKLNAQFLNLTKDLEQDKPIFARGKVFNSTVNNNLKRLCEKAGVPVISIHSLRHTHASLLIFAGVSIASIARRLGHANMTTTQQTYLHVIQELENQDNNKIIEHLSRLI